MTPQPISTNAETAPSDSRPFGDLRGVRWRIDLGVLPSSPSASVDDLRRATADSRRRYAALRRQLLIDPHIPKDGNSSPDLVIDNPLSQSPDSIWGQFFRNAELERMLDQDLTRLYPERSCGYFQTNRCQNMLRRILLLWCLQHPEYGYRQGMHEILAPLLYVLHVDAEVRKNYEDQFPDKFDVFSFHENDISYKFDFKKISKTRSDGPEDIQTIVLLSDAYGAEGELGIVLSEKFMELDAYSMFDSLMSGTGDGVFAMSDFFLSPSQSGLPPVIEASAAFYHLLSNIDTSLYTHLVELGVEPQYFGLRWLRLLFGREFSLEDLLVIWDDIFSCENTRSNRSVGDTELGFRILESSRGAFICAFGVSMILNLRSSLLATETATACLQRLLNFSGDVKVVKLLSKAKSLHVLALEGNSSIPLLIKFGSYDERRSRGYSLSSDSTSPKTPLNIVANSYWEEKWRVLHEEKNDRENKEREQVPTRRKGWSERVRHSLSRTESDPTSSKKKNERSKFLRPSIRRSLLNDLSRQLGSDEDNEITKECDQESVEHRIDDVTDDNSSENSSGSEEIINNSPDFSNSTVHIDGSNSENENEKEKESERSSVASNSLIEENDNELSGTDPKSSILVPSKSTQNESLLEKSGTGAKEGNQRKLLSARFQWLWKFGRNSNNSDVKQCTLEGRNVPEDVKACGSENDHNNVSSGEAVDQNSMVDLKSIGQSMLENIQVIEAVLEQNLSKNSLVGKGQVTAVAALKELRQISNLLSGM